MAVPSPHLSLHRTLWQSCCPQTTATPTGDFRLNTPASRCPLPCSLTVSALDTSRGCCFSLSHTALPSPYKHQKELMVDGEGFKPFYQWSSTLFTYRSPTLVSPVECELLTDPLQKKVCSFTFCAFFWPAPLKVWVFPSFGQNRHCQHPQDVKIKLFCMVKCFFSPLRCSGKWSNTSWSNGVQASCNFLSPRAGLFSLLVPHICTPTFSSTEVERDPLKLRCLS